MNIKRIVDAVALTLLIGLFIAFEEGIRNRLPFFQNNKIGFIIAGIVLIVVIWLEVVDPTIEFLRTFPKG